MPSNFEKRKAKEKSPTKVDSIAKDDAIVLSREAVYTQTALDTFKSSNGRDYYVAEIEYNPETGDARVKNTYSVSRIVGLQYDNHKDALNRLKKIKQ